MRAASTPALICDTGALLDFLSPVDDDLLRRAAAIDRRHAALRLGLVDAATMALAERLGITRIATRDVRHFDAVTLGDGRPFDLVVRPTRRG